MCTSCLSNNNRGRIELIVGCMFSGKTEEFIKRINRLQYAKLKSLIFKPAIDNRYGKNKVCSHNKNSLKAIFIKDPMEIYKHIESAKNIRVIGIDEIQFFGSTILEVIDNLIKKEYIIIVNGLDLDFRAKPFENTMRLMPKVDYLTKLHAVCIKCGDYANRTQRIINGKPAPYHDPIILIGSSEHYEARCRRCYKINK